MLRSQLSPWCYARNFLQRNFRSRVMLRWYAAVRYTLATFSSFHIVCRARTFHLLSSVSLSPCTPDSPDALPFALCTLVKLRHIPASMRAWCHGSTSPTQFMLRVSKLSPSKVHTRISLFFFEFWHSTNRIRFLFCSSNESAVNWNRSRAACVSWHWIPARAMWSARKGTI